MRTFDLSYYPSGRDITSIAYVKVARSTQVVRLSKRTTQIISTLLHHNIHSVSGDPRIACSRRRVLTEAVECASCETSAFWMAGQSGSHRHLNWLARKTPGHTNSLSLVYPSAPLLPLLSHSLAHFVFQSNHQAQVNMAKRKRALESPPVCSPVKKERFEELQDPDAALNESLPSQVPPAQNVHQERPQEVEQDVPHCPSPRDLM